MVITKLNWTYGRSNYIEIWRFNKTSLRVISYLSSILPSFKMRSRDFTFAQSWLPRCLPPRIEQRDRISHPSFSSRGEALP